MPCRSTACSSSRRRPSKSIRRLFRRAAVGNPGAARSPRYEQAFARASAGHRVLSRDGAAVSRHALGAREPRGDRADGHRRSHLRRGALWRVSVVPEGKNRRFGPCITSPDGPPDAESVRSIARAFKGSTARWPRARRPYDPLADRPEADVVSPENIRRAQAMTELDALLAFCFGYPFVMAWYWIVRRPAVLAWCASATSRSPRAAAARRLSAGLDPRAVLQRGATVAEETFGALAAIDYPGLRGHRDQRRLARRHREVLDELAQRMPRLRVVHLATQPGQVDRAERRRARSPAASSWCASTATRCSTAMRCTWMVRRFQPNARLGGLTGNPRMRNRATLLGRLQVGEFSAIVGLIKRAQTVYGRLFTVSGVICAFRKRALQDAGWWSPHGADRRRRRELAHPARRLARSSSSPRRCAGS